MFPDESVRIGYRFSSDGVTTNRQRFHGAPAPNRTNAQPSYLGFALNMVRIVLSNLSLPLPATMELEEASSSVVPSDSTTEPVYASWSVINSNCARRILALQRVR